MNRTIASQAIRPIASQLLERNAIVGPSTLRANFLTFVVALILCSFGIGERLFDVRLTPERVLAALIIASLPLLLALSSERLRLNSSFGMLVAWMMIGLFTSVFAQVPELALKNWLNVTLAVSFFSFAFFGKLHKIAVNPNRAIRLLGTLLGTLGLAIASLRFADVIPASSILSELIVEEIDYFRVRMLSLEPNLYGTIMMVFSILSISEWRRDRLSASLYVVASHAGLLVAFSRGPVLGYCVGIAALYLLWSRREKRLGRYLFAMVILSLIYLMGSEVSFESILDLSYFMRSDTITTRLVLFDLAFDDIATSPWFGNGIFSFSFMHPTAPNLVGTFEAEGTGWLSSLPFAVLYDTGLFGLGVLGLFFFQIFSRALDAIQISIESYPASAGIRCAVAWFASGLAIMTSSLSTTSHSLGFFWLICGIISTIPFALTRLVKQLRLVEQPQ